MTVGEGMESSSSTRAELDDKVRGKDARAAVPSEAIIARLNFSIIPLLQSQPTTNLTKHDVVNLIEAINGLESFILDFETSQSTSYMSFYGPFVALSANCIVINSTAVPKTQLNSASNACFVLLRYLLQALPKWTDKSFLQKHHIIGLIQGLCDDVPGLMKSEVISLCATFKSSKIPTALSIQAIGSSNPTTSGVASLRQKPDTISEPIRVKLDHSCDSLVEQLLTPLTTTTTDSNRANVELTVSSNREVKNPLLSKNLYHLQQVGGANVLLEFIMSLPTFQSYLRSLREVEDGEKPCLPTTVNEALAILKNNRLILEEYEIITRALSLPILEPFTKDKLSMVIDIIHTMLYVSVNLVTATTIMGMSGTSFQTSKGSLSPSLKVSSKSDKMSIEDGENFVIHEIVKMSLDVYQQVMDTLRSSFRVGGQCRQNAHLFGSWLIFNGIRHILNDINVSRLAGTSPSDSQDGVTRSIKQAFSGLYIPLLKHGVKSFGALLEDLHSETDIPATRIQMTAGHILAHDKFNQYTAGQRIEMLLGSINMTNLLFSVGSVCYRKSVMLRSLVTRQYSSGQSVSNSSSSMRSSKRRSSHSTEKIPTIELLSDDEIFNSSDDSSQDDDSEPILRQLFKESEREEGFSNDHDRSLNKSRTSSASCFENNDKKDSQSHIQLALSIFELFNNHFVCSERHSLHEYFVESLQDPQIVIMANIIRDLDRESQSAPFLSEFSRTLASFLHNLIATETLSVSHQNALLQELEVNPNAAPDAVWPLFIHNRTLSVLAQVILLRQRKENEEFRVDSGAMSLFIWRGLMNHLKKLIGEFPGGGQLEQLEDLNVEHAQFLLFIFHNLKLLQRKNVLLLVSHTIVELSETLRDSLMDYQVHYFSRLLHIFEYMMKHLYDPPAALAEQLNVNLFRVPAPGKVDVELTKQFFACKAIEDNYVNRCGGSNSKSLKIFGPGIMSPRFYYLMNVDASLSPKDVPKLDGMALSSVLTGLGEFEYDMLYDALMACLLVGRQVDMKQRFVVAAGSGNSRRKQAQVTFGLCTIQYAFGVAWRLFLQMPPSLKYLRSMRTGNWMIDAIQALHTVFWGARLSSNKWVYLFVKDSLQKFQVYDANLVPEQVLSDILGNSVSVSFYVRLLNHHINTMLFNASTKELVDRDQLPKIFDLFVLEALVVRSLLTLDSCFNLSENSSSSSNDSHGSIEEARQRATDLLPSVLKLVQLFYGYIRWNLLHLAAAEDSDQLIARESLQASESLLRLSSTKSTTKMSPFSLTIFNYLPRSLTKVLDKWNMIQVDSCSKNDYSSDTFIGNIQSFHFGSISGPHSSSSSPLDVVTNNSLKRVTSTLIRFAEELLTWSAPSPGQNHRQQAVAFKEFSAIVLPLGMDVTLDSFYSYCNSAIETIWGTKDNDEYLTANYLHCLKISFEYLETRSRFLDEQVAVEMIKMLESLLDSSPGQSALERFFCDESSPMEVDQETQTDETRRWNLVSLVSTAAKDWLGCSFAGRVLRFFAKLFETTERNPDTISLVRLCTSLSLLSGRGNIVGIWLKKILYNNDDASNQENRSLLRSLSTCIVKESSAVDEEVASVILNALMPMGTELLSSSNDAMSFPELMMVMATLAGAGAGSCHLALVRSVASWLDTCHRYLSKKEVLEKLESAVKSGRHQVMVESSCVMLSYLADVFESLKLLTSESNNRVHSPIDQLAQIDDIEGEWLEDMAADEAEESTGEDSDDDSLCNKLCTFTVTEKQFMNQHWYHCHDCKMVDGVGVCSICAKVCHKDHDVTYAKYGSFFCDCGAKQDGGCLALTKRTPLGTSMGAQPPSSSYRLPAYSSNTMDSNRVLSSSLRRRASASPERNGTDENGKRIQGRHQSLARQLAPNQAELTAFLAEQNLISSILGLLEFISPAMIGNCEKLVSLGSSTRAREALAELHRLPLHVEHSESLMLPTLGSQEGAFENVRLSYTGEQGQTIKQLVATNIIRRVAMCALTSSHGKRQHLAVSHEKGKITLLQLASLLKQADSSKRKLTLTRLASAPIPFTVLSLAGNPANEDVLAVVGLKDAHVLTFNVSGHVSAHTVLNTGLDAGNYILKTVWLPGSQSELALVTADHLRIFDLSVSATNAQYMLILPSGKIRDVTFMSVEGGDRYALIMSSAGHIYVQILNDEASARNGPFYVTSILEVRHEEVRISGNGSLNAGGVSVYYSHDFQLLFFGYADGKVFVAPLTKMTNELRELQSIDVRSRSNDSNNASAPQPLCQWSEVIGHPGLIIAILQTSNTPVVFMVKPESITVQEVKFLTVKSKITDMVALRHNTLTGELRTTMILLCEDGSLRILMASPETTDFWLRPVLNPSHLLASSSSGSSSKVARKQSRKHRANHRSSLNSALGQSIVNGIERFPVDFFEHCVHLADLEYGGNDLLQVYNVAQLRNRLNTNGMYIASTKSLGFTLEITCNDPGMVMVGIRVLVGSQDVNRAPSYLEINGSRTILMRPENSSRLPRHRWFDIPLTREESILAERKLNLYFGASGDQNNVTMVDAVRIYGNTKESFSWPDDDLDGCYPVSSAPVVASASPMFFTSDFDVLSLSCPYIHPMSSLDRLLSNSLEVLDGAYLTLTNEEAGDDIKERILTLIGRLLTLPFPVVVQQNLKCLLLTLLGSRSAYTNYRDSAILDFATKTLNEHRLQQQELDGEAFYRLICVTRSIASSRPLNLLKFGEFLAAISGGNVNIEMTTFNQEPGVSGSRSCFELDENIKTSKIQHSVSFTSAGTTTETDSASCSASFMVYLSDIFWKLYESKPRNPLLSTVAVGGLIHIESTVGALVEILHAFTLVDAATVPVASQLYMKLLLCQDLSISFSAKTALIKCLRPKVRKRRVFIPSPPLCETPAIEKQPAPKPPVQQASSDLSSRLAQADVFPVVGVVPPPIPQEHHMHHILPQGIEQQFDLIDIEGAAVGEMVEELVAGGGQAGFAPLLDLPADADDEAMMELAIALSLQDQEGAVGGAEGGALAAGAATARHGQQNAGANVSDSPPGGHHRLGDDRGHYSDTTASAAASDDEGSTAATVGSTLRTSPVQNEGNEPAVDVNSESGASGVESIVGEHLPSGRSSAYGEDMVSTRIRIRDVADATGGSTTDGQSLEFEGQQQQVASTAQQAADVDSNQKLHAIRLQLLEKLVGNLSQMRNVGGVHCIPMMQVVLMLSTDLESEGDRDRQVLVSLLSGILSELNEGATSENSNMSQRTPAHEVKLILMRLLSILMSRVKASSSSSAGSRTESSSFAVCSVITAQALINANTLELCLQVLVHLLDYWKTLQREAKNSEVDGQVQQQQGEQPQPPLKTHSIGAPPDMSPFFLKQYVKGHADDVFQSYAQLLTEMVLRLPYQIKKVSAILPVSKQLVFGPAWTETLCEYMMIGLNSYESVMRKQVRKLLSFICGSKEKYRQVRDFHALDSHMKEVRRICTAGGFVAEPASNQNIVMSLAYDAMISLIEHLKACADIANSRTNNWQRFCHKDPSILVFFVQISFLVDEGVSPIVLQLLQLALCPQVKPEEMSAKVTSSSSRSQALNVLLAHQLVNLVDSQLMSQFIQCFLFESNSSSLRWQVHSLVCHFFNSFELQSREQVLLLETLWSLWLKVPAYGRKAVQFVDLLGYFTIKCCSSGNITEKEADFVEKAVDVLRVQNQLLIRHPNSIIYNTLQGLVEFDGYYLESEPCLVCNNPEVNYASMKLSSVRVDSRFTTTTQIVKLVSSHTISKITVRISDIKRTKMVKSLTLYYNNRAVSSVVDLKNKTGIWNKAKHCTLVSGASELKLEFPLPIVACNLMIEYADFYENIQASSETLQCPRCSATVSANPGVCGNCGENVFQCHKCRAINYDEKDPFLCNSCGFCKYAKFDYTLTAKPTCAVDPIENEDDRKKTVQSINNLLEKADRVYKSLMANKPMLEVLLLRIQEHGFVDRYDEMSVDGFSPTPNAATVGPPGVPGSAQVTIISHVNKAIQQVAQKYCVDCKGAFDELSKTIQKVLASRKELVDYDTRQRERGNGESVSSNVPMGRVSRRDSKVIASLSSASCRCYGCASSTVEHCITLLKALSSVTKYRAMFCSSGLMKELLDHNLRGAGSLVRSEVRSLLCTLTLDNQQATRSLNNMIMEKVSASLKSKFSVQASDLSYSVRHEIALLGVSLEKEDNCWEQRLRTVFQLFRMGLASESPAVLESITLPCLRFLISLIEPTLAKSSKEGLSLEQVGSVESKGATVSIDLQRWLAPESKYSFRSWRLRNQKKFPLISIESPVDETILNSEKLSRSLYLMEKYGNRWKSKGLHGHQRFDIILNKNNWLRFVLFNRFSRAVRVNACSLIEALFQVTSASSSHYDRRKLIIDMLTSSLDDLCSAGEFGVEFFNLYRNLIIHEHWKYYLAVKGVLLHLSTLIGKEIEKLNELEETTLNSDLSEGSALRMLVSLLRIFVDVTAIRQQYKSRLVASVLNGYLSLRKLVVQRTKTIDDAQDTLLEMLEDMTTGTESETASFMSVCVDAVNGCKLDDLRTPVFIFERLCSIIYPEESETSEFFITLEKDPQQEDFLQGRMLGNPYSSNEPGMGPLMRDVKNKICGDCELVALLEDDSGMELLVRNKIISLDLPVKDVFKKVWCSGAADGSVSEDATMRIVYRMRGLLGDATEEFISSLDSKHTKDVDNEEVYRMANVMGSCGGLQVMLERLARVKDLSARSRPLLLVLLKLFGHCVKVRQNRRLLIAPRLLSAVGTFLPIVKIFLKSEAASIWNSPGQSIKPHPFEQLLRTLEVILMEASNESPAVFDEFSSSSFGEPEDIKSLLEALPTSRAYNNPTIVSLLTRIIPFLAIHSNTKMSLVAAHFAPFLDMDMFDGEHSTDSEFALDCFANLLNGIEKNANGSRFKDYLLDSNLMSSTLTYLRIHAPPVKSTLLASSDEWKEFTARPALKYVLRLLTGLASGHERSCLLFSSENSIIPVIHGLEQVSNDAHVGSLAEILLEELKDSCPEVGKQIETVRKQTRDEKKRLAMAVRMKQLGELGMRANEEGHVTALASTPGCVQDLGEETGLVCIICREGYKFQPEKVMAIYTFTKKCPIEPFDVSKSSRRSSGYFTVTYFNVVHVECHLAAVRHARGRDEWESAALQNANARCNGLLPLWGPSVPESAFATALARHNSYLQDATGHRDIGYASTLHDLKQLLMKFALVESFSLDSGGGGSSSNMHLIPYLLHMALYVMNTTRSSEKESKKMDAYLDLSPCSKWITEAWEAEGTFYHLLLALLTKSRVEWESSVKSILFKRTLVLAHSRLTLSKGSSALSDRTPRSWNDYKSYLLFFALVDALYSYLFQSVEMEHRASSWSVSLAEYIRRNDQPLLEAGDQLLKHYEQELLSCSSFDEYMKQVKVTDFESLSFAEVLGQALDGL